MTKTVTLSLLTTKSGSEGEAHGHTTRKRCARRIAEHRPDTSSTIAWTVSAFVSPEPYKSLRLQVPITGRIRPRFGIRLRSPDRHRIGHIQRRQDLAWNNGA